MAPPGPCRFLEVRHLTPGVPYAYVADPDGYVIEI